MRVALVHYWLVGMAGGEKVLEALCRIYPEADIFTHVLNREAISPTIARHTVRTTFINALPRSRTSYKRYLPLMPLALERLDLTGYDLVISSESGPAKGVVTRADSLHICYCHTPMRYLWDHWAEYHANAGMLSRMGMRLFLPALRRWDVASAFRVDRFVANSRTVARRIRKHWRRHAGVVYPPVCIDDFSCRERPGGEFYLCLGRLVPYKRIDLAVQVCSLTNRPLVVAGAGEQMDALRGQAAPCVRFLGRQDDAQVRRLLKECRALIFPGEEDFGIVPVEAAASGAPVLAYKRGGATETVREGVTGLFFQEQTADALEAALLEFERCEQNFDPRQLRHHAAMFGEDRFRREFLRQVDIAREEQERC